MLSHLFFQIYVRYRCYIWLLHFSPLFPGTPQHLKNKYGEGYHVTIRVARDASPDIAPLLNAMDSEFHQAANLLESSLLMAQYHISSNVAVSDLLSL